MDEIEDIRAQRLPNAKDMEVCETRKVIILGDTGKLLFLLPIVLQALSFKMMIHRNWSNVLTACFFARDLSCRSR